MSPVIQFHGCKGTKKLSKHHDNKRIFVFLAVKTLPKGALVEIEVVAAE